MSLSPFYLTYADLRARVAPFRMRTDFETRKTVANIDALMGRAQEIDAGAFPGGRFGEAAGHNVQNLMERATRYTEALERGEFPLRGMFCEPGMALIDHSFVEKDGVMHVFYIRGHVGYEWDTRFADTFGHAPSTDLVHWEIQPPCLTVTHGGMDGYQVWAPGVTEKDGVYYMYYTGVNLDVAQSICLATSRDLYTWEKYEGNPVLLPGAWGAWREDAWSDCRDSMVFVDDEEIIKVHVHTNDPGKALHEAMDYGSFVTVKIENMRTQYEDMAAGKAPQSTDDLDKVEDFIWENVQKGYNCFIVDHETGNKSYAYADDFDEEALNPEDLIRDHKKKEFYADLLMEQQEQM